MEMVLKGELGRREKDSTTGGKERNDEVTRTRSTHGKSHGAVQWVSSLKERRSEEAAEEEK